MKTKLPVSWTKAPDHIKYGLGYYQGWPNSPGRTPPSKVLLTNDLETVELWFLRGWRIAQRVLVNPQNLSGKEKYIYLKGGVWTDASS